MPCEFVILEMGADTYDFYVIEGLDDDFFFFLTITYCF